MLTSHFSMPNHSRLHKSKGCQNCTPVHKAQETHSLVQLQMIWNVERDKQRHIQLHLLVCGTAQTAMHEAMFTVALESKFF